jgi:Domain of unknown function (DUF4136)
MMMIVSRRKGILALLATVLWSVLILVGCAPAIKYSYDMKTSFSEPKRYTWAKSSATNGNDPLLETNVQVLADQVLAQKGFTRTSENPDLILSMSYEFDSGIYQDSYRLQTLSLYVYLIQQAMLSPSDMPKTTSTYKRNAPEGTELVWRGTASDTIKTDAASDDLKHAVQGILSNFPLRK